MSVEALQELNGILALGGIVAIGVTVIILADLLRTRSLSTLVQAWGIKLSGLAVLSSVTLTLYYSEVIGIVPCGFCWLERVMLYPQLLLIAGALYFKDTVMLPRYGIILSGAGLLISLYHHYIQMGGSQFIACPTGGSDCAKRFMFEYGFVTFPLLSAILFAFLIVLYIYIIRTNSSRSEG